MERYYTEYGKFIIHFEEICFVLNHIIRKICTQKNMFSIEDKRIEILLQGLTAQPILTKFQSIILTSELLENKEVMTMIETFISNFQKVIEHRNFLAHGTFFYGDPHANIDKFQVRNTKLNKKGFYDNTNIISIESLSDLNKGLFKLMEFIKLLGFYISNHSKNSVDGLLKEMKLLISDISVELKIEYKSVQH